jgi:hypothetical protein
MPYVSFDDLGTSGLCGEFPEGFKHHGLTKDANCYNYGERTASKMTTKR